MKVLHLGKYYPPHFGGIERVNYDLVESINQQGICADVLCFNDSSISLYEEGKYKIYRAANLFTLRSTPFSISLLKILRQIHQNYDIIHLHLPNPMGAIALQLVNFKGKIVIHWHSDIIRQKTLKKFLCSVPESSVEKGRPDYCDITTISGRIGRFKGF